jgi:anti-sigma-K factor RskA
MNVHEQFADDLALYALGALPAEERRAVEQHLEECAACRQELERLQGDMAMLAFSVDGPKPPARSRDRLMTAIAKEPRRAQLRQPKRRIWWWEALGWAAALAAILIGVLLKQQNSDLRHRVAELETRSTKEDQQLLEARQLLSTLTSPDADHFTLVAANASAQPQGKAIYLRSSGTLVFLASNLPAIPPEKAYELWLIPASGAPIPAGLFKPNAHGAAAVVHPPLPIGVEAKAFAITIEPEAGSSGPTSQPIMLGSRG